MVLAVLPKVGLVGVAEGVHDGLEDRFQNFRVAIYTKSTHKKFRKLAQKLLPIAGPPVRVLSKRLSVPPPLMCVLSLCSFFPSFPFLFSSPPSNSSLFFNWDKKSPEYISLGYPEGDYLVVRWIGAKYQHPFFRCGTSQTRPFHTLCPSDSMSICQYHIGPNF